MTDVRIPPSLWDAEKQGDEASLVNWLVADGAEVSAGDEIAELMVEKVTMVVDAPAAGTLHIKAPADAVVHLGDVIATIEP